MNEIKIDLNKDPKDNLILKKPIETKDDFESRIREFENKGVDKIRELAKSKFDEQSKPIPESPKPIENKLDPIYNFLLKVTKGEISEKDLESLAKSNCKKCFGRGYKGYQLIADRRIPVVCNCIVKLIKNKDEKIKRFIE